MRMFMPHNRMVASMPPDTEPTAGCEHRPLVQTHILHLRWRLS